jgi:hypothetical protein
MSISEVRSPWCSEGNTARSADNPPGRSPISTRSDQGHLLAHVGKNGPTNPKLRSDSDLIFQRSNATWPPVEGDRR